MAMIPQKTIEVKTVEGDTVRIRVYARGIVIERGTESVAFIAGVRVPDWLVEKAPEEIEPRELFRIKNPEVISRFIIKVGFRRLMAALKGRVVDKEDRQRLILFDDAGRTRTYLMGWRHGDPWQLEEVDAAIRSVESAHDWRRRRNEERRQRERKWRGFR